MEEAKTRWLEFVPVIEKGIADSATGVFVITETALRDTHGISDAGWLEMLEINDRGRFFIVSNYLFCWRFRRYPA